MAMSKLLPCRDLVQEISAWRLEDVGREGVGRLVNAPIPKGDPFFCLDGVNNILGADGSDEDDELEERAAVPEDGDFSDLGGHENGIPTRDANQLLRSWTET